MREENVLLRARFDERLQKYWMLSTLFVLAISFIGIPLLPVWLIVGWGVHRKQYESLECELTERTLNVRRGFLFRVEKSIPLDKIQDVSMKEGPILRYLGLSSLGIETAGQSVQGGHDAALAGVIDAPAFRDAILNQRDKVVATAGGSAVSAAPTSPAAGGDAELLGEIRDTLKRIEVILARERSH